jgi:hypothetical protein
MKVAVGLLILILLQGCNEGGSSDGAPVSFPRWTLDQSESDIALLRPVGSQTQLKDYILAGLHQWTGVTDNSATLDQLLGNDNRGAPYAVSRHASR